MVAEDAFEKNMEPTQVCLQGIRMQKKQNKTKQKQKNKNKNKKTNKQTNPWVH